MDEKTEELLHFIDNTEKSKIFCVPRIYEILDEIKSLNTLVIVEGKKDRSSLQKFGIKNIIELSKNQYSRLLRKWQIIMTSA